MPKANETRFRFFCGDLDKNLFRVAGFTGKEQISNPYRFEISLCSNDDQISPDDVLGACATLFIMDNKSCIPYSGVVSEFQVVDKCTDYCLYSAVLVPRLWKAGLNIQSRIFQKVTIADIVKTILDENSIGDYQIKIGNAPQQEFVVQYAESDLNFISRLMESAGVWYMFSEGALSAEEIENGVSKEKLIITDDPEEFCSIDGADVVYKPVSGLDKSSGYEQVESVFSLSCRKKVIPGSVVVRNYNYRNPEVELSGKKAIQDGCGATVYQYGGSCKKGDEMQSAAEVLYKQIVSQQIVMNGTGNKRGFRAGMRFNLKEHFRNDFNVSCLLTGVDHSGGHLNSDQGRVYRNEFTCIPGERAACFAPGKSAFVPKVHGIFTGMVESDDQEYACLDELGRYKIRLPFDASGKKNDCAGSKYIRLAQPSSGAQYGIHFPSKQGTEMVLACVDGDPSKPLGLGTIPNANTISPVVSTNKQQNIIRTAGGNELLMDDTSGKQRVRLITPRSFCLEMDDEKGLLVLRTSDKKHIVIDEKNSGISLTCGENTLSISSKDNENCIVISTGGGHVIRTDDKGKRVTLKSGKGLVIDLDDENDKVVLKDKQSALSLDKTGIVLNTGGKLQLNADGEIEISGANLYLESSSGEIGIKAAQALKADALNIEQKATAGYKIDALQVETKAKTAVKIEGMSTEIKGNVNLKASAGASAEISAGGMTTVKGGIVMIN